MATTSPAHPHTLRFRQVHLDFHTGGDIPEVGARFVKARFQQALRLGRIDSITLFAKCHHGWSYHPTAVGRTHPHLHRDLLGEQIAACREIGVRCPIYLSAGFDEVAADAHPDWVVQHRNGVAGRMPLTPGWRSLSFDTPYLDYLCAQIAEVVQRWPDNDGIFLDIISPQMDYSPAALRRMVAAGLDPAREADVAVHAQRVVRRYCERATAAARSVRADTPVFHNSGHIPPGAHDLHRFNSHFELESLPTGGWGYDHFPLSARYAITQRFDFLGMTGKFHGTWGEFGGFKRPEALRYECAAMLANGAKCSVGDQLHPSGEMNPDTYDLIGAAYAEVEAKEAWTSGVVPAARIALVSSEQQQELARGPGTTPAADEGAARMLLELHQPFVILDTQAAWDGYAVVVLPDGFRMTAESRQKAVRHLAAGGRILAAGSALLDESGTGFAIDPGARLRGRSACDPDYLVATALAPEVPVRSAIHIPGGAYEVEATTGAVLAERRASYFNRTWDRFSGHFHTPDAPGTAGAGIVAGNGIAYFAHDLFSQYRANGLPLYRDFVRAALGRLLPEGMPVATSLPTVARFNLLEQPAGRRYVAHLLYAPITLRATPFYWNKVRPLEIIEDLIPLHRIRVAIRVPQPIHAVTMVPGGTALPFSQDEGMVSFTVPEFTCHQMVELAY